GATSVSVNSPITGWGVGDLISIDTEAVTVTSIAGNTVNFTPSVGQAYYSTTPVHVGDLSRSVVIRSSGTNTSTNSAYVGNLARNTTSFAVSYGEFEYLGAPGVPFGNLGNGIDFLGQSGG